MSSLVNEKRKYVNQPEKLIRNKLIPRSPAMSRTHVGCSTSELEKTCGGQAI